MGDKELYKKLFDDNPKTKLKAQKE